MLSVENENSTPPTSRTRSVNLYSAIATRQFISLLILRTNLVAVVGEDVKLFRGQKGFFPDRPDLLTKSEEASYNISATETSYL